MGLPGPAARLLEDFSALEDLPVAMALLSCDGRILRTNAALCGLLGRERTDLLGAATVDLVAAAERPTLQAGLDQVLTDGTDVVEQRSTWIGPDGDPLPLLVRQTALRDTQGTPALVVVHVVPGGSDAHEQLAAGASRADALIRLAERLDGRDRTPSAVAELAACTLHEILGGGVTVYLVDPSDGTTVEAAGVHTEDPAAEAELRRLYAEVPLRTDAGLLGEVCRTQRTLVVEDPFGAAPPAEAAYGPWLAAHPLRALLLVPLLWEGRVLGVLGAGRHDDVPFTDCERADAEHVARLVVPPLAEAQLRALDRSAARRQQAVARVTRRCDEALGEPAGVLAAAVRAVSTEVAGPCAAWLLRHDADGALVVDRAAGTHPDPAVEDVLRPSLRTWPQQDRALLPRVLDRGSASLVGRDRIAELVAAVPALRQHADALALEALYAVRLQARGAVLGVLAVGSVEGRLSADDRHLVDALADRVGLALDNAALLEQARTSRSRSRALVEHCSDLLLMADAGGAITYASPAAARTFGRRLGESLLSSVVPEDRAAVARFWTRVLERPGLFPPMDVRVLDVEGRLRRLSAVANNLLDDPGVSGVVLTVRDVTEERAATERLAERAGQQAALAAVGAAALTAQLPELYRVVAKSITETLESTTAGVLQLLDDDSWLVLGGSDDRYVGTCIRPGATSGLSRVRTTGRAVLVGDYASPDEVVETEVVELYGLRSGTLAPVVVDGRVWGVVTAHSDTPDRFSDVDTDFLHTVAAVVSGAVERERMAERAVRQATTDDVTGLPNRVAVHSRLSELLSAGAGQTALLLLDLDDFKDVNDALGHGAGDQLLRQLARRVQDVVGDSGLVGRLGGDEFAVVLRGGCREDSLAVADDVVRTVAEPFALPGIDVTLSGSVGVAVAPEHGRTAEQLLQAADMAMYRAKSERSGRALFDADLDSLRSERLALLSELRVALSAGELVLHYQPLVDLRTERVVSVEALLRWQHPQRGLLLPGAFLATAEQTDLVHGITRHVIRAAARQAAAWRNAGWQGTVAVNVSAHALRPPEVVAALTEELRRARGLLTVELTESALADERVRDALQVFSDAGVACSIDDFGTGWSSLSYLRDLPVRRLKLDRTFNRDVHQDERDAAIVGSAVQMAHALGLDVVAEGVETEQVAQRLRQLDVDVAQGWLYGRPQAAAQLRLA